MLKMGCHSHHFPPAAAFLKLLFSTLIANRNGTTDLEWGQSMACLIFGKLSPLRHKGASSNCVVPGPGGTSGPPTHTRVEGNRLMIYEIERTLLGARCEEWHLFCIMTDLKSKIPGHTLPPTPHLSTALKSKNQSPNMLLRSHNGAGMS